MHSSEGEGRHYLVLVVEDDEAIRRLIAQAALEEPGMQVLAARDGAEALAAFAQVRPDVVLLDLHLPGLDGTEVCRRLKADPATSSVPVVGFSAGANEAEARAAGCDDFVAKPFELDDLMARLRRWWVGGPPAEPSDHRDQVVEAEPIGQPDARAAAPPERLELGRRDAAQPESGRVGRVG